MGNCVPVARVSIPDGYRKYSSVLLVLHSSTLLSVGWSHMEHYINISQTQHLTNANTLLIQRRVLIARASVKQAERSFL